MSDETPASHPSADPGIDLSLSFGPAWAREGGDKQPERLAKLAERHGDDADPRERRGGPRGDKRGPRRHDDRGPRPERSGGDRRDRRDAPGRRHDGPRGQGGQGGRPERAPRPEPGLTGWKIQFTPDRHGVDGLAKQIKTTARAYPLFDLARLVLEKSERYLVDFRRIGGDQPATPLFQCRVDGTLWLNEADAIAHLLATQLDKYYRRESVPVDPPKGAFPFVAVCGMSGTLLGPPNYHDYQAKLVRLHQQRFANLPFETFKARVRMERDEALIEKWRQEQSTRDLFYPVDKPGKPQPAPAPDGPAAEPAVLEPVATEPAAPVEPLTPEPPAEAAAAAESPAEAPEIVAAPAPAAEVSEDAPAAEATPRPAPEALESLADVERHFRAHHAAKAVVAIRERVLVPGPAALNDSAPAVLRSTRAEWDQLNRFPLPLAHVLGQQLAGRGLHLFKAHENITYVNVARPKYLDRTAMPVSEAVGAMLDYIESHAQTPRADQWKALVALRPEPAAEDPAAHAATEAAVAADLSWLLHEGHVIDFVKRGLEAARKPKTPPPPKPKKTAPAPAAQSSTEAPEIVAESAPVAEVSGDTPAAGPPSPDTPAETPATLPPLPTEVAPVNPEIPEAPASAPSVVELPAPDQVAVPSDAQAASSEGEAASSEGEAASSEGEAASSEGEAASSEGEAASSEGATPPPPARPL